MLVECWLRSGAVDHPPPKGWQSVTVLLDGRLRPALSASRGRALERGDLRWCTWRADDLYVAEARAGESVRLIRWLTVVEPCADTSAGPCGHDTARDELAVRCQPGLVVQVYCGSSGGVKAVGMAPSDLTFVAITLEPGVEVVQELAAGTRGLVHVMDGTGHLGDEATRLASGRSVFLPPDHAAGAKRVRIVAGRNGLQAFIVAAPDARMPTSLAAVSTARMD
jgi:quercetin 2,3-dioxygenase